MKKIVLIDGNGLIFRAYYATANRMSSNSDGIPTNAIYLFSSILIRLLQEKNFDDILVALDSPGKKFRHQEFNNYKANRKEVPIELKMQFAPIKEFLKICNIKTIEIEGYEADDIIGTLVSHAKEHDAMIEVYTGDRDLLQLIDDNVLVNMMHKGLSEVETFDRNHLKEVYNISPLQIIDVKALMGDSSDNIPGVKGVGEKTAFDLINTYQSLNNIYDNIEQIKGKLKEKLLADKEMAFLSYELATIERNVPIDLSLLDDTYDDYDHVGLNKFFKQYGIKSLLKFTTESEDSEQTIAIKTNIVDYISKDLLNEESFIFVDVDNRNYHYGNIKGLAIANKEKEEYILADYITFDFDLIDFLSNKNIKKNVFDSKQAYILLRKMGINLENVGFDILLAFYLLDPDFKTNSDIFEKYNITIEPLIKNPSLDDYVKYALCIAKASCLLKDKVLEDIKDMENENLLFNVEQPLAIILAKMEMNGVLIDTDLLKKLDDEYSLKIKEVENKINDIVGHPININSPKQLAEYLFDELKLPCSKKRSTNADDLKQIENMHEVVPLILQYRKFSKLLNSYISAFEESIFADNRIHAMFNQSTTMTGRLSSSNPNLQNLAVRDDERKIIRKLVIAPKNYKILSLDYSQIELRILAILSNDENLLHSFLMGDDIHASTAAKIYNIPLNEVTPELRRVAKAINFGIVYGISAWGLSEQIGLSLAKSQNVIDKFFKTYPRIKEFLDNQIEFCQKNGYVTTILKRRRKILDINSSNYNSKEGAKRIAMNTPIQGSAADVIKIAMVKVDKYLNSLGDDCHLICQIHDELLFEVLETKVDDIKANIQNIMENVLENQPITLKVSGAIGDNWLEAK